MLGILGRFGGAVGGAAAYGAGGDMSPYGAYGGMVAAQYGGAAYGSAAAGAGYTNDTFAGAGVASGLMPDYTGGLSVGRYGASTRDTTGGRSERTFRPY